MSWDVSYKGGSHLPQAGWWLDAHKPVDRSFVSHAHSDHLGRHREILCTPATARLIRERMPSRARIHALPYGHTEALTGDIAVTLLPAGHIVGSAQALLEHPVHGRLLFTGDFKLRPGLTCEPCATPQADTLIMETTFGRPRYVFPPSEAVLASIARFCEDAFRERAIPVLMAYSLGKSQEVAAGLAAAGIPAMLHPSTFRMNELCRELGAPLPPAIAFDAATAAGHAVICPPQAATDTFFGNAGPRRTAIVTGWALDPGALYRSRCDAAFPLSDHADFPDLLRFVERVRPSRVLTLHGFAADFAGALRARGIDARALTEDDQLDLQLGLPPSGA